MPVDRPAPRRFSAAVLAITLSTIVVVAVVAGVAVIRSRSSASDARTVAPASDVAPASSSAPSDPAFAVIDDTIPLPQPGVDRDEQLRRSAEEHSAKVREGGWVRYAGDPAIPGDTVPAGWVAVKPSAEQLQDAAAHGMPVYDVPGGTILGYHLASVGYVPKATAEAPGFDAEALRRQREAACPTSPAGC